MAVDLKKIRIGNLNNAKRLLADSIMVAKEGHTFDESVYRLAGELQTILTAELSRILEGED